MAVPSLRQQGSDLWATLSQYMKQICRIKAALPTERNGLHWRGGGPARPASTDQHAPSGRNKLHKRSRRKTVSPPLRTMGLRACSDSSRSQDVIVAVRVR